MLTSKQVSGYQEVYRREYGEEISPEEATEQATIFLNLIGVIYKPIPKADYEEITGRHDAYLKDLGIPEIGSENDPGHSTTLSQGGRTK